MYTHVHETCTFLVCTERSAIRNASLTADGHGEKGKVDPCLLRRAAMVCALCLKLLDGMTIEASL